MTDIVERLCGSTMGAVEWTKRAPAMCVEAAAKIEEMRALLREALDRQESGQRGRSLYQDMSYLARVRRALND